MTEKMFCFQCEQAAHGTGCTNAGVCGKSPSSSKLQDELTVAAVNLALTAQKNGRTAEIDKLLIAALFSTMTNVSFDDAALSKLLNRMKALSAENIQLRDDELFKGQEDEVSLRTLLLLGLRGMAAYAWHANELKYYDEEVSGFIVKGLAEFPKKHTVDEWLTLLMELGGVNLKCMELLDKANTETYGHPVPAKVSMTVEPGPFIVVSGHDLSDLHQLLEQTKNKNIAIYTHGEMLPAHGYPNLKKYSHLKGHFGTAWQNQQKEFKDVPGAFLFTSNCLMPVREYYADRVFTTALVGYPGLEHVEANFDGGKNFTPVIEKALALGGYKAPFEMRGINGGTELTTGFAHNTVLSVAGKVIEAVKTGGLKHIFLVGGCDGAKPGRNYYTEFVKQTPSNTLVLTLACGKFRFNDLDLGTLGGIPRLLDMGQCNDAYSAIKVASALAEAFACGVNDLPLTLILSWYEQKAVCILLTLLSLGIQDIRLGPTLPAFVSPAVLNVLQEKFNIKPIADAKSDLDEILG